MAKITLILTSLVVISFPVQSAPSPLKIDKNQKRKVNNKYIRAAHDVIKHDLSTDEVRFAILNAGLASKGVKWLLEKDSDEYLILRWDYGEAVIYTKVEYNNQFIQLKYFDSHDDFNCTNNVDGICYRNQNKDYYAYMKKLRASIARLL
jgi:hypothetical protein